MLGKALAGERELDEAECALREALGTFRKLYPPGHKSVVWTTDCQKTVLEAKRDSAGLAALNQVSILEKQGNKSTRYVGQTGKQKKRLAAFLCPV